MLFTFLKFITVQLFGGSLHVKKFNIYAVMQEVIHQNTDWISWI